VNNVSGLKDGTSFDQAAVCEAAIMKQALLAVEQCAMFVTAAINKALQQPHRARW
jgi:hypothetical protein